MEPWAPLVFEFRGAAKARLREKEIDSEWGFEEARHMNDYSGEIAAYIRADLKRSLPPGLELLVEIEYFPGSLEWLGVVTIMDWASRIADNISLGEYVTRAIRVVVNRVNRRYLRRRGLPRREWLNWMEFDTEVHQVGNATPCPSQATGRSTPRRDFPLDLRVVLYANTVLLILILALLAVKLL